MPENIAEKLAGFVELFAAHVISVVPGLCLVRQQLSIDNLAPEISPAPPRSPAAPRRSPAVVRSPRGRLLAFQVMGEIPARNRAESVHYVPAHRSTMFSVNTKVQKEQWCNHKILRKNDR
ncbi:hypothetical protein D3C81_1294570 [compost metagenome]